MPGRLAGKVAVISGSGTGIGQAIAIRYASEGATVVVNYLNHPEQADETKSRAEAAGGKASSRSCGILPAAAIALKRAGWQ